jgi:iron complex outermembrane receptor protein
LAQIIKLRNLIYALTTPILENDIQTSWFRFKFKNGVYPKIVTDLGINFFATTKLTIALNVNNLLTKCVAEWKFKGKTLPELKLNNPDLIKSQYNLITFNGRYSQMTYEAINFSQLGTLFNLSLNYKF